MLATIEARLREVNRIDEGIQHLNQAMTAAQSGDPSAPDGMRKVLDLLSFGVVLLSATQVIFMNRTAREIHDARDGISIDKVIHTDSAQCSAEIRTRWREACEAARQDSDCIASLAIPRPSGARDFHLTICPLPDLSFDSKVDAHAVAFLTDPQNRPAIPAGVLADFFDLTPTEGEVARLLAHGLRTDEIASELSIAPTTVAFHLRNLLDKTGTRRQADLIVLILTGLTSIEAAHPAIGGDSTPRRYG